MRVVECTGWSAVCVGRGVRRAVNLALVGEQSVGAWVLVIQNFAREVLAAEDALRIDCALDGVEAALRGETDLSSYFEDLAALSPGLQRQG